MRGGVVYHYCPAGAFHSIISNRALWASDYRFMNDAQDFRYGINVLDRAILARELDHGSGASALLRAIISRLRAEDTCMYSTSFSERGDDSAQWSRYAGENGFAIGFNRSEVESISNERFFDFGKIEYDSTQQKTYADAFVGRISDAFGEAKLSEEDIARISQNQLRSLGPVLSMFKDRSFSAEKEWRMSAVTSSPATRERFRVTRNGLVPYTSVELLENPKAGWDRLLKVVVAGPGALREANLVSAKRLMRAHGINCAVISSETTFRF